MILNLLAEATMSLCVIREKTPASFVIQRLQSVGEVLYPGVSYVWHVLPRQYLRSPELTARSALPPGNQVRSSGSQLELLSCLVSRSRSLDGMEYFKTWNLSYYFHIFMHVYESENLNQLSYLLTIFKYTQIQSKL